MREWLVDPSGGRKALERQPSLQKCLPCLCHLGGMPPPPMPATAATGMKCLPTSKLFHIPMLLNGLLGSEMGEGVGAEAESSRGRRERTTANHFIFFFLGEKGEHMTW